MNMPWYLGNWDGGNWLRFGIVPLTIWSLIWTGLALWHAAKRDEKGWFILFLLVHTAGILEIVYLVLVVKLLSKNENSVPPVSPAKKTKRVVKE